MAENGSSVFNVPYTAIAAIVAVLAQFVGIILWAANEHSARLELEHRFEERTAEQKIRIDYGASRLDRLIEQIDRLDTPLSQKVRGNEIAINLMRDQFSDVRIGFTNLNDQIKTLRDTSDQRQGLIIKAGQGFEDINLLKVAVEQLKKDLAREDDRVDRVVMALDQTYNLVNEHMRQPHVGIQEPPNKPLNLPKH